MIQWKREESIYKLIIKKIQKNPKKTFPASFQLCRVITDHWKIQEVMTETHCEPQPSIHLPVMIYIIYKKVSEPNLYTPSSLVGCTLSKIQLLLYVCLTDNMPLSTPIANCQQADSVLMCTNMQREWHKMIQFLCKILRCNASQKEHLSCFFLIKTIMLMLNIQYCLNAYCINWIQHSR